MAISLNDHENRIKNFEAKLPDISNRITNLEKSNMSITRYDAGAIYEIHFPSHSTSYIDVTSYLNMNLKNDDYISGEVRFHAPRYSQLTNDLQTMIISLKNQPISYELKQGTTHTFGFKIENNKIYMKYYNSRGSAYYIGLRGFLIKLGSNNLYYKLLDRVSSLFSEVISCLSA